MESDLAPRIEIFPHDERWARLQQAEIGRLREALGLVTIEPVGSTAVPGLAAKPVIDLLLGYPDIRADALCAKLEALAYRPGQPQSDEPGTLFLEGAAEEGRVAIHLHIAEIGGLYWRDLISFRDALRSDPETARQYEALKRKLAHRYPYDIDAYASGKSEFVASVLEGRR